MTLLCAICLSITSISFCIHFLAISRRSLVLAASLTDSNWLLNCMISWLLYSANFSFFSTSSDESSRCIFNTIWSLSSSFRFQVLSSHAENLEYSVVKMSFDEHRVVGHSQLVWFEFFRDCLIVALQKQTHL